MSSFKEAFTDDNSRFHDYEYPWLRAYCLAEGDTFRRWLQMSTADQVEWLARICEDIVRLLGSGLAKKILGQDCEWADLLAKTDAGEDVWFLYCALPDGEQARAYARLIKVAENRIGRKRLTALCESLVGNVVQAVENLLDQDWTK